MGYIFSATCIHLRHNYKDVQTKDRSNSLISVLKINFVPLTAKSLHAVMDGLPVFCIKIAAISYLRHLGTRKIT